MGKSIFGGYGKGGAKSVIYIIVLAWNQYALTRQCIQSLLAAEVDEFDVHILVVDNGSTDGTKTGLLEEFGSKIEVIVNEQNVGFAGGNNLGIHYALEQGAEYIMILNNDTCVSPGFLSPLLDKLKSNRCIGVVTPKICFMHEPHKIWAAGGRVNYWLGKARSRGRGEDDDGKFDEAKIVDYTTGCCFLAPRDVFEQVGFFNKSYFVYFEDTDWSMRVKAVGLEIWYEPASCIQHIAGGSSQMQGSNRNGNRSSFLVYFLTRNNLWFINSHIFGVRRFTATLYFFVSYVIFYTFAYIVLGRWQKLWSVWKGVRDGYRTISDQ